MSASSRDANRKAGAIATLLTLESLLSAVCEEISNVNSCGDDCARDDIGMATESIYEARGLLRTAADHLRALGEKGVDS